MSAAVCNIRSGANPTLIVSWYLYKSKIGIAQTDQLVQTIIRVTWETAALPTASMLVAVVFYCGKEVSNVSTSFRWSEHSHRPITQMSSARHLDLFFSLLTAKLYTLGILRTLNSRTSFRESIATHDLGGRQSLNDYNSSSTRVGSLDQTVSTQLLRLASTIQSNAFLGKEGIRLLRSTGSSSKKSHLGRRPALPWESWCGGRDRRRCGYVAGLEQHNYHVDYRRHCVICNPDARHTYECAVDKFHATDHGVL